MNVFKIALIQMDLKFGDVDYNLQKTECKIREAHAKGAQVICLPEGFNTGYYCKDYAKMRSLAEPVWGTSIKKIQNLAQELSIYIIAPIFMTVATGIVENTAVLVDDEGMIIGTYSKTHLVGEEQFYCKRGKDYPVFHTKYGNIGILICYDICFPETARLLALKGADVIICPSAWRDGSYFKNWLNQVAEVRALDNTVYVALINRVGKLPDAPFCGCTQVVDPVGRVLGRCSSDQEEILYEIIDQKKVYEERMGNSILLDRHPEDYALIAE